MSTQKLGITTLVAIGIASFEVAADIKETQKDGFQLLPDLSTIAFKDFGKIQYVATNAPKAWEELKDLSPAELADFEAQVSAGANIPNDGVAGKVRASIRLAARVYAWGEQGYIIFEDAKDMVATF